jgi:glycosyltransferase involved in cell wall biosynthesis
MPARPALRVAFINPHSDPLGKIGEPDCGGQCIVEKALMENLTALSPGVRVDSYTRQWGEKPAFEKIGDRAGIFRISCKGNDFVRKEDLYESLPEFTENMLSRWQSKGLSYDILHAHYADGAAVAALASRRTGAPFVFTAHSLGRVKQKSLPDEAAYRYSVRIPAEETAIREAVRIIALNETEKGYYRDLYACPDGKIRVVANGIDLDLFSPGKRPETGPERTVFATGRLDKRKGFDLLARAVPAVCEACGKKGILPRFLFPEGRPPHTAEESEVLGAIRAAVPAPYDRHLRFFGRLSLAELVEHYRRAHVFACPSPYEPFGLVVIEAMGCGTPVVATKFGGPADIITPGRDGRLVDPADTEGFAQALSGLLTDDNLQRRMGEAARKTIADRYSWTVIAQETLKLYQSCLKGA